MSHNQKSRLARLEGTAPVSRFTKTREEEIKETQDWMQEIMSRPDPFEWIATADINRVRERICELQSEPVPIGTTDRWLQATLRDMEMPLLRARAEALGYASN